MVSYQWVLGLQCIQYPIPLQSICICNHLTVLSITEKTYQQLCLIKVDHGCSTTQSKSLMVRSMRSTTHHCTIDEAKKRYIKPHHVHIGSLPAYFFLNYVLNGKGSDLCQKHLTNCPKSNCLYGDDGWKLFGCFAYIQCPNLIHYFGSLLILPSINVG